MTVSTVLSTALSEGALFRIDKPAGPTSHDIVHAVRRHLGVRRVGHAGTLDPPATGLLVIGVGPATRLLSFVAAQDKVYRGTLALGTSTDTLDATGRVVARRDWPRDELRVRAAAQEFLGEIGQKPPMVSAVKVGGERLYRLAAQGQDVERLERRVHVRRLEVLETDLAAGRVEFLVECSSGTYVRSIAQEWAQRLESAGHLRALRRLSVGRIHVEGAFPGGRLARRGQHPAGMGAHRRDPPPEDWRDLESARLPWGVALSRLTARRLTEQESAALRFGKAPPSGPEIGLVRLESPAGRLLAIAEAAAGSPLRLRCVLVGPEPPE